MTGSISDVASAADEQKNVLDKIAVFVAAAKAAAVGGITWGEFTQLALDLLRLVVSSLDTVKSMTGAEKKAAAIDAVGMLFDALADKAIPTVVWPVWLIVRSSVRTLILAMAGGAVEYILPTVRKA